MSNLISPSQNEPAPHCAFKYEGRIHMAINPSAVKSLPGLAIHDPEVNLDLRDLRKALWAVNRAPELAYMLRSTHAQEPFFAHLHFDRRVLPIVQEGRQWFIDREVRAKRRCLEDSLLFISNALLEQTRGLRAAKFPFDAHWPLPRDMGYLSAHTHSGAALRAFWKSRDAFYVLAARCSMAITLTNMIPTQGKPSDRDSDSIPLWQDILMKAGATYTWIDEVNQSLIADLSPGLRVGAFINPLPGESQTQWLQHVPCMIRANLPVYIYWPCADDGDYNKLWDDIIRVNPFLRPYRPSGTDVLQVPEFREPRSGRDRSGQLCVINPQTSFRWDDLHPESVSTNVEASRASIEDVPHGPGQWPGESFQQFKARRAAQARAREQTETPERKAQRLAREAEAAQYNRPTHCSLTTVYLWTTVGKMDPMVPSSQFFLPYRMLVGHSKTLEIWAQYPNSAKHYGSWHNEWDLCGEVAEAVEEDQEWVEEMPQVMSTEDAVASPILRDPTTVILKTLEEVLAAELDRFYRPETERCSFDLRFENTASIFFHRYGINGINPPPEQLIPGSIWLMHNANVVRKHFGLPLSNSPEDPDFPVYAMSAYIAVLMEKGQSNDHFGSLWDLNTRSGLYLGLPASRHNRLQITRWDVDDELCFGIRYVGEPPCWYELLVDAVTALELCRQRSISSRPSAVAHLSRKGVRLRTAYDPHPDVIRSPPRTSSVSDGCLGWRRPSFRASVWDYAAYEERAFEILSSPRGRAAFLHSGLVWRLAIELLGPESLQRVMDGPSADVPHYGRALRVLHGSSFYEDALSQEEIDI